MTTKAAIGGGIFGSSFSLLLAFLLGHEALYPRALYTIVATGLVIVVISLVTSPSEGEVPTGFLDKLRTDPDEAIAPDVRRLALAVIGIGVVISAVSSSSST